VLGVALVVGLLFVVLAGSGPATNKETADTPLIGKPAPPIKGPTLHGGEFDLAGMRGNWVVLNFFQSSCVPCKNEHPELVAFADQQARLSDGAQLVTVVWSDDDDKVAEFFAAKGGDWPVVLDRGGQVPFDYGVTAVPETWIIDPAGRVDVHYIGEITAAGLSAKVQELRDLAAAGGVAG
jgi:cytochrome c biogenesis protein CcmG/thiol:disulfide interchange protein DsbE